MVPGLVAVDPSSDASYEGAAGQGYAHSWAERCDSFDEMGRHVNLGGRFAFRFPLLNTGVSPIFHHARPAISPFLSSALAFLVFAFLLPPLPPSLGFAAPLLPPQL
jgi:hypothetical protein